MVLFIHLNPFYDYPALITHSAAHSGASLFQNNSYQQGGYRKQVWVFSLGNDPDVVPTRIAKVSAPTRNTYAHLFKISVTVITFKFYS